MTKTPTLTRAIKPIGTREFVVLMAMLQALQALSIDAMLPALGVMSLDLGVASANQRQLVVGLYLIFAGLGSLIPGALADRYGRRPVLLVSLGLFVSLTIGCALANSFVLLLVLRAMLGFSSGGLRVLPSAIIRDRYEGDQMARMQSLIGMVFMVVPMIAPSLGLGVLLFAGWRWIFGLIAGLGAAVAVWCWLRLPESMHAEFRQTIKLPVVFANMREAITARASIGYVFGMACMMGAMFGFINSAQQLVAEHFGAGKLFPLMFGGTAAFVVSTNFLNASIVERFGARRVSHAAMLAFIVTSMAQVWLAHSGYETLWSFYPLLTLNFCLISFIGSNFGSIALQPFARTAGAAASAQAFFGMVSAAAIGSLVGNAYDNSARPLAMALLIASLTALVLVLYSEKGRLFRRLYPQGTPRPGIHA